MPLPFLTFNFGESIVNIYFHSHPYNPLLAVYMKYLKTTLLLLLSIHTNAQTENLLNYEVTLIGPNNVNLHHPKQVLYYLEYFDFLEEEVDIWLKELSRELNVIKKRNRRRIEKERPIKSRDYPTWKKNSDIIKDLEQDKLFLEHYKDLWQNFDHNEPDSVTAHFMNIFNTNACYDLISEKLVLSPKEYDITTYEPTRNLFYWKEFIPKNGFQCPDNYQANGKTCWTTLSIEVDQAINPIFLIQNKITDLPFHLDGFKQITCP